MPQFSLKGNNLISTKFIADKRSPFEMSRACRYACIKFTKEAKTIRYIVNILLCRRNGRTFPGIQRLKLC